MEVPPQQITDPPLPFNFRTWRILSGPEASEVTGRSADHNAILEDLTLKVPRDTLLVDLVHTSDLAQAQGVLYLFAKTQADYASASTVHMREPWPQDREPKHKDLSRYRRPIDPLELGKASAAYAEASLLYGIIHDQPGVTRNATLYFGIAHTNLIKAKEYVECAYNARRAAEAAARMGEKSSCRKWAAIGEWDRSQATYVLGQYEVLQKTWNTYKKHEGLLRSDDLPRWYSAAIGATLGDVEICANDCNKIPPEIANNPDKRIPFLAARYAMEEEVSTIENPGQVAA